MKSNHTIEGNGPNALLRAEREGSKDRSGPFAIRHLEGRCRELDPDYAGSTLEADVLTARKLFDELTAALQALLRAPAVESGRPGSVTIEVQTFNLNAARAALAKAHPKRSSQNDSDSC